MARRGTSRGGFGGASREARQLRTNALHQIKSGRAAAPGTARHAMTREAHKTLHVANAALRAGGPLKSGARRTALAQALRSARAGKGSRAQIKGIIAGTPRKHLNKGTLRKVAKVTRGIKRDSKGRFA